MNPHFYIIAGEASGDFLGAQLMRALKQQAGDLQFSGIGGAQMEKEGLNSLFPIQELSLMGLAEILPHIPRLLKRVRQTVRDVEAKKPTMVITIDSPGFNFRVAKKLRKKWGSRLKLVHYVAPSVWAYKPKRAHTMAQWCDHVLCLLPFEPAYFELAHLPASFVGHPVVSEMPLGNGDAFRARHALAKEARVMCVLPGSRRNEILKHMPVLEAVVRLLAPHNLTYIMPVASHLMPLVQEKIAQWAQPCLVIDAGEKQDGFAASDFALAKSGTVSLELAVHGVPMVTFYKVNKVTAFLIRKVIRIVRFNLVNILLGREVIPECMQEHCTPENIYSRMLPLLEQETARAVQQQAMQKVTEMLGRGIKPSPSEKAAQMVLSLGVKR